MSLDLDVALQRPESADVTEEALAPRWRIKNLRPWSQRLIQKTHVLLNDKALRCVASESKRFFFA